jgi:hypothetical protein
MALRLHDTMCQTERISHYVEYIGYIKVVLPHFLVFIRKVWRNKQNGFFQVMVDDFARVAVADFSLVNSS